MILVIALTATVGAQAQKLAIGERAPEVQATQWLTEKPAGDKARLINFYHSLSREAGSMLADMNRYAGDYPDRLEVLIVAREPKEKVQAALLKDSPKYSVAIDGEGKTFGAFGVNVVPFAALVDARGKVLWFGNPAQLDAATLDKLLK